MAFTRGLVARRVVGGYISRQTDTIYVHDRPKCGSPAMPRPYSLVAVASPSPRKDENFKTPNREKSECKFPPGDFIDYSERANNISLLLHTDNMKKS